jgi:hypothetical protein
MTERACGTPKVIELKFKKMKLFYLINEPTLNYQVGYREAIRKLINEGDLTDCLFYSFDVKLGEFDWNWDEVVDDIVKEVSEYRPDAVLFAHTCNKPFRASFFKQVKQNLGYKPVYALDERDAYGRFTKKLPGELLSLSRNCDVTFLSSSGGWLFNQFKFANKGQVMYLPQCCDDIHFGKKKQNDTGKLYDVVMIGNLLNSRIPFLSMPGVKKREMIAKALYKRHGKRFAVFGAGWEKYPFSAGTVPFFEQEKVLHSSNLSIGVDHFLNYDQYYSDRLPIALFSSVPHLSWETPRLNSLFKEGEHVYYYSSVEESVSKSDSVLSGKFERTDLLVLQASNLVRTHYTEAARMRKLIKEIHDIRSNQHNC